MQIKTVFIVSVFLALCSCQKHSGNTSIDALMSNMTIEQKIGQLRCPIGFDLYTKAGDSVTMNDKFDSLNKAFPFGALYAPFRADPWSQKTVKTGLSPEQSAIFHNTIQKNGIPYLIFEECPHGHMALHSTVFPTGIGLASTWDRELIEEVGEAIGLETRCSSGNFGLGPVIDIARDPRWSRVEETFGEDPYLSGELGLAFVRGMQKHIPTVIKHFAAYGIPQGGHNGGESQVGTHRLLTDYIYNFETVVKGGAAGIMTSYNAIDGVPCTSNNWLLNDILREQWKFEGLVISDLGSIWGLKTQHHIAETQVEAAALALNASVDIDLGGSNFGEYLYEALQQGLVSEKTIDRSVRRVLKAKSDYGLFDNRACDPSAFSNIDTAKHKNLAYRSAAESIVLLKNNGILPLGKGTNRIAVIGPNADNTYNQLGDYTAPQFHETITTILEGLRSCEAESIEYVKGCAIRDTAEAEIDKAVSVARKADAIILVVGGSSAREFETDYENTGAAKASDLTDMECGEGCDRHSLNLLGNQEKLMKELAKTGKPLVVIYIEGRPLLKNFASEHADALLTAWYPGAEGGRAIADILFGNRNPAGRLPITVLKTEGQIPLYYSMGKPNRYVEGDSEPLYPFGYGLSYTSFEYSDLQIEKMETGIRYSENSVALKVNFTVTNTGERDGEEVAQVYVRDETASTTPAERLLKGFKRVKIAKGESKRITIPLTQRDLATLGADLRWRIEAGAFDIMVGASSADIRLEDKITMPDIN